MQDINPKLTTMFKGLRKFDNVWAGKNFTTAQAHNRLVTTLPQQLFRDTKKLGWLHWGGAVWVTKSELKDSLKGDTITIRYTGEPETLTCLYGQLDKARLSYTASFKDSESDYILAYKQQPTLTPYSSGFDLL